MPYFYRNEGGDNDVNILFVHIPKTGGSSFENYLSQRYNIPLNRSSLFGPGAQGEKSTYQHIVSRDLLRRKKQLGIKTNGIRIIALVRNPYDRIISELFYIGAIDPSASPEKVAQALRAYLESPRLFDNHKLPQYEFIVDDQGKVNTDIEIVHLETVQQDLANLGFPDFNNHDRINKARGDNPTIEYDKYLNEVSIRMINDFYAKDFQLFGYDMKMVDTREIVFDQDDSAIESMMTYQDNIPMPTLLGFLGAAMAFLVLVILGKKQSKSVSKIR